MHICSPNDASVVVVKSPVGDSSCVTVCNPSGVVDSTDMEPLTGFLNIENKHVGRPSGLRAKSRNKKTVSPRFVLSQKPSLFTFAETARVKCPHTSIIHKRAIFVVRDEPGIAHNRISLFGLNRIIA